MTKLPSQIHAARKTAHPPKITKAKRATRDAAKRRNEAIAYNAGYIAASYPVEQPPYRDAKMQAAFEKGKTDRAKWEGDQK